MRIVLEGIEGLPEVSPGDDLGELIAQGVPGLRDGDVVVVTSKVVSKAEGRIVSVANAAGRGAVIEAETARLVASWGDTRIAATRHGFVVAAAGVDGSNTQPGSLLLLPVDPDASARGIRARLHELLGRRVGVVITDTFGRPWRVGQADVAIGAAGLAPLEDLRGRVDAWGNVLGVTVLAVADEVAAAADLVKRKLAGMPVAVVHGLGHLVLDDDGPGAAALIRPLAEDRFALGVPEAARAGVWTAVLDGGDGEGHPGWPRSMAPPNELPLLALQPGPVGELLTRLLAAAGAETLAAEPAVDGTRLVLRARPTRQLPHNDSPGDGGPAVPAGQEPASRAASRDNQDDQAEWYVEALVVADLAHGQKEAGRSEAIPVSLGVAAGRALERARVLARAEGLDTQWVEDAAATHNRGTPTGTPGELLLGRLRVGPSGRPGHRASASDRPAGSRHKP